jgi:hypothetical protein
MVTRLLSLCVCLLLFCSIVSLGIAEAANPGPPYMGAPLRVPVPGPPGPMFGPGANMGGPSMAGCPPPCPPPCAPPSCAPPGCPPPACGESSWLGGFNPLCGILSIVTAPFRLIANCVAGDKNCQPLPSCAPPTCAPMCMPPCPPPCMPAVTKCKPPKGMQRAAFGYPPMGPMGQPMMGQY